MIRAMLVDGNLGMGKVGADPVPGDIILGTCLNKPEKDIG